MLCVQQAPSWQKGALGIPWGRCVAKKNFNASQFSGKFGYSRYIALYCLYIWYYIWYMYVQFVPVLCIDVFQLQVNILIFDFNNVYVTLMWFIQRYCNTMRYRYLLIDLFCTAKMRGMMHHVGFVILRCWSLLQSNNKPSQRNMHGQSIA